jgi:transposase-like protein
MNREIHVRICEGLGVKFPWSTRLFLTIKGEHHYLWRAIDQDGHILDILVQRRRDKRAAKKFFRKLLKGLTYVPRVIVTDKLKSYGAAKRELLPSGTSPAPSHMRLHPSGSLRGQKSFLSPIA